MVSVPNLLRSITDFALPPRCPICGVNVEEDHKFCTGCWQNLDFINEPWCAFCGIPFAYEHALGAMCGKCLVAQPDHQGVRAVVVYDEMSAKIAMGLKYSAKLGLADLIADHLSKYLKDAQGNSLLIPVPLHRRRMWSRGFNQSILIANALSKTSGIKVQPGILKRRRATPPLKSMSAKQRRRIVKNAFILTNDANLHIEGKTVFLVDDVYTTGSTANACAKLLKTAGAKSVYVLCWARVLFDDERK